MAERQRREHTRSRPTALPPSASNFKHGAQSGAIRKRYGDLRTREGRALQAVLDAVVEDLGGQDTLTGSQRVVLDSIRTKLIVIFQVARYVEGQPSLVDDTGELLPVLGKNYITYTESLRRDLQTLHDLAGKRPKQAPDLEAYLATKKAEGDQ